MSRVLQSMHSVLGIVFVAAGVGKVFLFVPFGQTMAGILRADGTTPGVITALIIMTEFSAGGALVMHYRVVLAGSLLLLVMCTHLSILASAIAQGIEIPWCCLGMLNLRLSSRWEMILNLVVFNVLASAVFLSAAARKSREKRKSVLSAVLVALLLLLEYAVLGTFAGEKRKGSTTDATPAVAYAEDLNSGFLNFRKGNRLLFLIEFSDFNCPPCFDDFMILCDEVKGKIAAADSSRIFLMFRRGELADPAVPVRLNQWLNASGLNFPAAIGPDSLFEGPRFTKSCVLVISPSGRVLFREVLPIGPENRGRVLRFLADAYAPDP